MGHKKTVNEYKEIRMEVLFRAKHSVEATVAYDNQRLVFDGQFTIDRTRGSYRWGEQLQFDLWTNKPVRAEARATNEGYSRIQIALPIDELDRIATILKTYDREAEPWFKCKKCGDIFRGHWILEGVSVRIPDHCDGTIEDLVMIRQETGSMVDIESEDQGG